MVKLLQNLTLFCNSFNNNHVINIYIFCIFAISKSKNLKKNISIIFSIFLTIVIALILNSCANIVSPSGGPKDEEAPKPINSIPANYSKRFDHKKIEITFNEFIVLKDIASQLIVSPPFEENPEIKVKGKTLVIDLKENLKENTTYTLYFGDAITDLTEGNPVSSYEFVFTTGDYLDSLTITGSVKDAFTHSPEKDVFVLLYDKNYDSIPYKEKPYYISKTKENGSYTLRNLRDIPYKIFALKDLNNNLKFDQIIEKVAFFDSLVMPHYRPIIKTDSTLNDTIKAIKATKNSLRTDSLKTDSLKKIRYIQDSLTNKKLSINDLRLFQEIDSSQKILKAEFKSNNKIIIEFRFPVKDMKYDIPDSAAKGEWKIDEWSKNKDSLIFWLTKPDIDSLSLIFNDLNNFTDTIHILKRKNSKTLSKNIFYSNLSQTFNFYEKIKLYFVYPVLNADSIPFTLISENDTTKSYAYFTDKFHRVFNVKEALQQNKSYKFILNDSIIQDIAGNINDSLVYDFKTNSQEDFGNFILNINTNDSSNYYIIQLVNEKAEIIKQAYILNNEKLTFKNINPGNYSIKAIKDKNGNQRWDTGKYLKKIQPEEIFLYPSTITIRANWDLDESWIF